VTRADANTPVHAQVVVVGAGPGGYSAAFRAADLGCDVVLVERHAALGGVCLNVGCIPSKALLHVARVMAEAADCAALGVTFGAPDVNLDAVRAQKNATVTRLTQGVAAMAQRRGVRVLRGEAAFLSPNQLSVAAVEAGGTPLTVTFEHAIVAAGSSVARLPGIPYDDPRVWDSTAALELREIPRRLLVVGGGIIGLEMATVYDALGSAVTVVEWSPGLLPGADRDLVAPLLSRIEERYEAVYTGVGVSSVVADGDALLATFAAGAPHHEGGGGAGAAVPEPARFDAVLVAVGRTANGHALGLDAAGVVIDADGRIPVDAQRRTNVPTIFAIGDLTAGPMVAHKAAHEGHVAAEVIAGVPGAAFDVRGIPAVAYTDPQVAWVGLTETQAAADHAAYAVGAFPWSASGRALATGGAAGRTKLLVDPENGRLLGAGIVGSNAGELIAEPGFALEMGADAADLALTVHAHPTLSETVGLAAQVTEGTVTDLPRQRPRTR
jgi:dihydrolipoamide dehydrogenase